VIPRISVVAEGPTDVSVVQGIIGLLVEDFELVVLQPESTAIAGDFGERGGGYRGVLRWCEALGQRGGPTGDPAFEQSAAVIVHVDADVSDEPEFGCRQARTGGRRPHAPTTSAIAAILQAAIGAGHPALVFCIPNEATEAWLLPRFRPYVADIEALSDPAREFVGGQPKLCRFQAGRLKKDVARYQAIEGLAKDWWPLAVQECGEAWCFDGELRSRL
jgi:hypothetical protein